MPSKSRKKIKGQERKAKAKAAAANNTASNLTNRIGSGDTSLQSLPNTSICKHGLIQTNNTIGKFISAFFKYVITNILELNTPSAAATLTADALSEAYNKFPEAVNNESNREIIKTNLVSNGAAYLNDFTSVGASALLVLSGPSVASSMARSCAAALMFIDSYAPSSPVPPGRLDHRDAKVWLRNLDILGGCQRSLVKYFVKQMPCNCLDQIYAEIKSTTPKMGHCQKCRLFKERTNMFICTGCERVQYCSKACQIANVLEHKDMCKEWQKYDRAMEVLTNL